MNDTENSIHASDNSIEDEFNDSASNLPKNKLIKSRDNWKQRAGILSSDVRKMQEEIRNLKESRDTWKNKAVHRKEDKDAEISSLEKNVEELKKKLTEANSQIDELKKKPKSLF